jgi:hypothetical protein
VIAPLLVLSAVVALPDAGARIDVPEGWIPLPPKLQQLVVDDWRKGVDWGPVKATAGGLGWGATDATAALYALWVVSDGEVAALRPLMARRLEESPARARRASLKEGGVTIVQHREELGDAASWAFIEFTVPENGTRTLARTTLFVDEDRRLHEVRAECMFQESAAAAIRPRCEAALASLTATVKLAEPSEVAVGPTLGPPNPDARPMREPAEGKDKEKKGASRMVLLALGGVVVIGLAWWLSRKRDAGGQAS